ncbi:MAG TPA: protein kinase [Kofleriaceae bacterium]|nr:protein kinase [Kofleriaceae bacterium]
MRSGRAYLSALAELHRITDPDERRRVWRQGMAALAAAAEVVAAPLEGIDPEQLLAATRAAMTDGLLLDFDWMSGPAGAIAQFELAAALPAGAERRELGRRVLTRLRDGDVSTFAALATALALSSPRALSGAPVRVRLAAALAQPAAPGVGAFALALVTRPELERDWLVQPSQGSLSSRRIAARLLERAAREAVRRRREGDRGALAAFVRPTVREVWRRLLLDRESLVWRHAAIARGLVSRFDSDLAAEIERELDPSASPSDWRRGATSTAAALEIETGAAIACRRVIQALCGRDAGVARALMHGLGGAFAVEPEASDGLALELVEAGETEAIEALADLRREAGLVGDAPIAPRATAAATWWIDRALAADRGDDGTTALRSALRDELAGAEPGPLGASAIAAREALTTGDLPGAIRAARAAVDELAAMVEWLERASDDDAIDRRHALRVLRELDQHVLADGVIGDVLSLSADAGAKRALAALLERLERRVLATEAAPETVSPVPHFTLRLTRLRALIRLLDADATTDDDAARRDRRLDAVRTLMSRAPRDTSPLRRAVWAGLARAWDALLRDEQADLADLLIALTASSDPDDDFAIVREATMQPEVAALLDAYAEAGRALTGAVDPDDRDALAAALIQFRRLAEALPVAASPRTEALRAALGRAADAVAAIASAGSQASVSTNALDELETALAVLAQLGLGARRRLGLPLGSTALTSDAAVRTVALALERQRKGSGSADDEIAAAIDAVRAEQVPVVASAVERALLRVAHLPREGNDGDEEPLPTAPALPPWLPLGRTLGGFYIVRPIGKGAGGSVFVATRGEDRHRANPPLVALKVPDYGGGAARSLSEQEFEDLFREEAGALLSLPTHSNIARFVTFDAGARPKPVLVMELVRGPSLERVLEVGELDLGGAFSLIDGIAGGLTAMHQAGVAHLDLKPANVILREGSSTPVLVDFGLAGRHLRPGCGSPHYGAPEVWVASTRETYAPFPADVYAFACLAYEILTGQVLVTGESLSAVLGLHLSGRAGRDELARMAKSPRTASIAELLLAATAHDASHRPTVARVRAGFASLAPDLRRQRWPLEP